MKISIITLFPDLYKPFFESSLIKKAAEKGLIQSDIVNLFSFVAPKERIDSPIYGPGSGMLLKPEIVEQAIDQQEEKFGKAFKIFFSPQGKKLNQHNVQELFNTLRYNFSNEKSLTTNGSLPFALSDLSAAKIVSNHTNKTLEDIHLLLFASRYEGVDSRVEEYYADEIISIGDYVLMGGDLPAMVFMEALLRFVPGVVGKEESVQKDSFMGPFVDFPTYTAPIEWKGLKVPEIIRSGNHKAIEDWRLSHAIRKTVIKHFEWLRSYPIDAQQIKESKKYIPNHYAVLMHSEVLVNGKSGFTSVTSLDLHDIARSATTYGLENYFIVTPLEDQKKIVKTLIDFWQTGVGIGYNPHRHEAVGKVFLKDDIKEVIQVIKEKEGKEPILISTSAKFQGHDKTITYYDQEKVWSLDRPVLFVFGTGSGLTQEFIDKCDFLLGPIYGFSEFNHLSVRSAAAIIFDRWLGINRKF